jgi:hypothetical protein
MPATRIGKRFCHRRCRWMTYFVGALLCLSARHLSVDGTVIEGNGVMNEAFLTGEPFEITRRPAPLSSLAR